MPILPAPAASDHHALVDTLRFEPILHFQVRFGQDFAIDIASRSRAPLYVFAGGSCRLRLADSGETLQVAHGDVVFLPHGGAHRVFDHEGARPDRFEDLLARDIARAGQTYAVDVDAGSGADVVVSGSFFWTSALASNPLMAQLPAVLHLRGGNARLPWLPPMTDLVRWMSDVRDGGRGVGMAETVNALIRHLVLHRLQGGGARTAATADSQDAPRDPRVMAAIRAIHTAPAEPWTLASLARLCHMSRTSFATRFQQQARLPPMAYLARWRVHLAARLLREQRLSLDEVARRVGYSSGAILARAYKRVLGSAPRATRRGAAD